MHPARKFSQNLCKNKTLSIQSTFNKENDKTSLTESFAKKFSVGSHVISDESDPFKHKKSIADQKISVFLDHTSSQNRGVGGMVERTNSGTDEIRYLYRVLQNQEGNVADILSHEMQKNEIKSQDVKKLVYTLIQKLSEQQKSTSSYSEEDSFRLTDHIMKPYLQQEIILLQKNLSKLKSRQQDLVMVKNMNQTERRFLVNKLKQVQVMQKNQLSQMGKINCY